MLLQLLLLLAYDDDDPIVVVDVLFVWLLSFRALCICMYKVVDCPVCGLRTKVTLINGHLDRCLSDPFPSTPPPSLGPPKIAGAGVVYKRGNSLPRLPKVVFSIMKDKELKKKLREYHLPTCGQRKALIARLEEFTLQYKAQQDSLCPKSGNKLVTSIN